jgi:hypothetical protein
MILSFRIPDQVEHRLGPESNLNMDSRFRGNETSVAVCCRFNYVPTLSTFVPEVIR